MDKICKNVTSFGGKILGLIQFQLQKSSSLNPSLLFVPDIPDKYWSHVEWHRQFVLSWQTSLFGPPFFGDVFYSIVKRHMVKTHMLGNHKKILQCFENAWTTWNIFIRSSTAWKYQLIATLWIVSDLDMAHHKWGFGLKDVSSEWSWEWVI